MSVKKSLKEISALAEKSTAGICVSDEKGEVLFVNSVAASFTEYAPRDCVGKHESELFGMPAVKEICGSRRDAVTCPKNAPDGNVRMVSVIPLETENGSIIYYSFLRTAEEDSDELAENPLLIYKGSGMSYLMAQASKLARIDATVLISGESGTGKVMMARYLHHSSKYFGGAFVSVNCAAMSGDRLEEELFGRKTGDRIDRPGAISMASGGTLFLDEINAMPLFLQTKFLYALQEKRFHPLGSRIGEAVECRMIASTNRNLPQMIAAGEFREDLYYSLGVFELSIPPVRERKTDVIPLVRYLTERCNRRYGLNRRISSGAMEVFSLYSWPGNLREMENTVERLVVMCPEDVIDVYHLPDHIRFRVAAEKEAEGEHGSLDAAVSEVEKTIITKAYQKYKSSYEVARALKISQSKANRMIRKYCTGSGG